MHSWQVIVTADGSPSIASADGNLTFHSREGAWQETDWIYGRLGLQEGWLSLGQPESLRVLELGFGSGLNALWAWQWAEQMGVKVDYETWEAYLLEKSLVRDFTEKLGAFDESLCHRHHSLFEPLLAGRGEFQQGPFRITLQQRDFAPAESSLNPWDICFFDAFAPSDQPELWTASVVEKIAKAALGPGSRLVTYSVQGQFRRCLEASGFKVEKRPGPGRKKQVTLAVLG